MPTTRFPNGVTTAPSSETLGEFILPDPTKAHVYFNDFDTYVASDWTITTAEAGAGSASETLIEADGGALRLLNAAGASDHDYLQKAGNSFLFETNFQIWFKARFQLNDVSQTNFVMGLQDTDTTPLNAIGTYFRKNSSSSDIVFVDQNSSGATARTIPDVLADNTYVTVGFYVDKAGKVAYFINDQAMGAFQTNEDANVRTISFGVANRSASASSMTIDYIFAAKQR